MWFKNARVAVGDSAAFDFATAGFGNLAARVVVGDSAAFAITGLGNLGFQLRDPRVPRTIRKWVKCQDQGIPRGRLRPGPASAGGGRRSVPLRVGA